MGGPRSDFSERGSPEFWGQAEPRRAAPVNPAAGLARAIGDRYKRNTFMAMRDNFIEQAALRFEKYAPDSEEAAQSAQLLRDNPKVFHMMASQFGGGGAGYGKMQERFKGQAIQGSRRRILDTLASGGYDEEGEGLDAQATYQRALADLHEEDRGGNDWLRKTMQPRRESRVADLEARGQQLLLEQEGGYSGDADQALAQLTQYFSENGHPDPAKAARTIVNNLEAQQTAGIAQDEAGKPKPFTHAEQRHNTETLEATDFILQTGKVMGFGPEGFKRALDRGGEPELVKIMREFSRMQAQAEGRTVSAEEDADIPKNAGLLYQRWLQAKRAMNGETLEDYRGRIRSIIGDPGLSLPEGAEMIDQGGVKKIVMTEEQEAQMQIGMPYVDYRSGDSRVWTGKRLAPWGSGGWDLTEEERAAIRRAEREEAN